jgi:hypothetical protein
VSNRRNRKQGKVHPAVANAMIDDAAYRQGPRGDLERRKAEFAAHNVEVREWLADYLRIVDPEPGQKGDGLLGTMIGVRKRSGSGMPEYGLRRYFGRIQRHYPETGSGEICEAEIVCAGLAPPALVKACARAERQSLDQMLGNGRPAGFIIVADVEGNVVRVRAMVNDASALTKIANDVYSGMVIEIDENDRVYRVSLYDTDQLEKGGKQDECARYSTGKRR